MAAEEDVEGNKTKSQQRLVRVWDLPTRLFHWSLVALVTVSYVTAEIGGNAMLYHEWSGLTILVLILFRIFWGFVGSRPSRFVEFLRGPTAVFGYASALLHNRATRHFGHNPLGGWSIMAMLLALFVQAGTGLFANDDIATEGPLYGWVSKAASDGFTRIHKMNQEFLIILVGIHVLAVIFYLVVKRENLLRPMITGVKPWSGKVEPAEGRTFRAAIIFGLAALAVYWLIQ